ncbi:MAG: YfbK domain-containing protein [Chitinophagaceae bacterium]
MLLPRNHLHRFILCCLFYVSVTSSLAQYYVRGQVKDVKGNLLPDVQITLVSKHQFQYKSGSDGSFGIPSNKLVDTLIFELNGFETKKLPINTKQYVDAILLMLPETISSLKTKLNSQTKNLENSVNSNTYGFGESYTATIENEEINTAQSSQTNYTLNIDRASYSNIRRFLNNGYKPPIEAVRIEELLNYFDFSNTSKKQNSFIINSQITSCPWSKSKDLLFIQTQAPTLNTSKIMPTNFVFLIDVSGSMDKPNRLPLVQAAFKLLIKNLRANDSVAIVTYGGGVDVMLPSINCSISNVNKINNIIDSLYAVGDTPGEGAIKMAYSVAKKSFIKNGNNRVILATDGDFNVGQTSEKELEEMIGLQKSHGIYLTCLGVGMGNYKDSKLEALAKKGNGNFAYLDNIKEAEKVLVQEFTKTMFTVAKDAYVSINFNKNCIDNYRLIGYDNKKDALADSHNILEGGEVGSGHSNITVFEISKLNKPNFDSLVGEVKLFYKGDDNREVIQNYSINKNNITSIDSANQKYKLAACIAWFGSLLKSSKHTKNSSFEELLLLLTNAINKDNFAEVEFLEIVKKAANIYEPLTNKKKKKKRGI